MTPQFKIHGNERRMLKKILYGMKKELQFLMIEHDVNQVYGVNSPVDYVEQVNKLKSDIDSLVSRLSEKYDPKDFKLKVNKFHIDKEPFKIT